MCFTPFLISQYPVKKTETARGISNKKRFNSGNWCFGRSGWAKQIGCYPKTRKQLLLRGQNQDPRLITDPAGDLATAVEKDMSLLPLPGSPMLTLWGSCHWGCWTQGHHWGMWSCLPLPETGGEECLPSYCLLILLPFLLLATPIWNPTPKGV